MFLSMLGFVSGLSAFNRTEPLLTPKAIEFLEEYLSSNPNAKILEFGSGASTLWFAEHTKNLISIDHSKEYYDFVKSELNGRNVDYRLIHLPYYHVCDEFPDEFFDLIVVDGRNRKGCIAHSIPKLKSGGILMLDNAEREHYAPVYSLMENWEYFSTKQIGPDKFGFSHPGWMTDWWIKP